MSTLEDAFDDQPQTRANLAVWLQVANFYYASSIRIVGKMLEFEPSDEMTKYLEQYEHVFKKR